MPAKTADPKETKKTGKSSQNSACSASAVVAAVVVATVAVVAVHFLGYPKEIRAVHERSNNTQKAPENVDTQKQSTTVQETSQNTPTSNGGINVKFVNKHNHKVKLFWIGGDQNEVLLAEMEPESVHSFSTFESQMWVFRDHEDNFIRTAVIHKESTEIVSKFETEFHKEYEERTGKPWLNVYPREPMIKYIPEPIEIGHIANVEVGPGYYTSESGLAPDDTKLSLEMTTAAVTPKIFQIKNFISDAEADHIREAAITKGDLKRSGVKTTGEIIATRTSSNTWLDAEHDDIIQNVFRRAYSLLQVPFNDNWRKNSESLQVVHYNTTQEYQEHYDYFGPTDYPAYKSVQEGNNRYATVFMYLNDVEKGGETMFPRAGNTYVDGGCTDENGFRVKPSKGDAAIFFSMLPDGNLDVNSLHAGCPVIIGEKWGANLWFWDHVRE